MNEKESVVFTNGCFDIIHAGHIHLLRQAKLMGKKLIVGLNSDLSIRRLKGKSRPINGQNDRLLILSAIRYVDDVIIFEEDDPLNLIKRVKPDILVKGSDYSAKNIIGADYVISNGGIVKTVDIVEGRSTSNIIERLSVQSP